MANHYDEEKGMYCYQYPHAAVTADCVIFGFDGRSLKVLLIRRGIDPYKGYWAIPGGFMKIDESIEMTAKRELMEETNLTNVFMEQFKVFSEPGRDPRERVLTVAFIALVRPSDYSLIAGDDAVEASWFDEDRLPSLAFDHGRILHEAREYLKEILRIKPIAFELLNKTFSLSELQRVYEVVNREHYDRRNFQRTVLETDVVREADPQYSAAPVRKGVKLYQKYSKQDILPEGIDAEMESRSDSMAAPKQKPKTAPTKGLFDFFRRRKESDDDFLM